MPANRIRYARWFFYVVGQWSLPLTIGITIGLALSVWQLGEIAQLLDQGFSDALQLVVQSCKVGE